ncbi:MAG: MurR/RpiR family transcriptional regulator [Streptococcaceae bacterium]|nr:MurR/RpiR family transcriptional regulator [Streptococcaceae bacterium]
MKKDQLSSTEKFLWNWMQENRETISRLTISQISQKANVSPATVTRTVKKMGYDSLLDFRQAIAGSYHFVNTGFTQDIEQAIVRNEEEVVRTINSLRVTDLEKSLQLIEDANRIFIFCVGFSAFVGIQFQEKLQLHGKNCILQTDPDYILHYAKTVVPGDLVFFYSLSGTTKELIHAAKDVRNKAVKIISVTSNPTSPIAEISSICLPVHESKQRIWNFTTVDISSRISLQVIARILIDAWAIRWNRKEQ